MKIETFEQFCDMLRDMVTKMGENLGPQDDWEPMLFLDSGESFAIVSVAEIGNPEVKPFFCGSVLPDAIVEHKARFAGLVHTAWAKTYGVDAAANKERAREDAEFGRGRVQGRPGMREIVSLLCAAVDGGANHFGGDITRSDAAPTLTWWPTEKNIGVVSGEFYKALRTGLDRVKGSLA